MLCQCSVYNSHFCETWKDVGNSRKLYFSLFSPAPWISNANAMWKVIFYENGSRFKDNFPSKNDLNASNGLWVSRSLFGKVNQCLCLFAKLYWKTNSKVQKSGAFEQKVFIFKIELEILNCRQHSSGKSDSTSCACYDISTCTQKK